MEEKLVKLSERGRKIYVLYNDVESSLIKQFPSEGVTNRIYHVGYEVVGCYCTVGYQVFVLSQLSKLVNKKFKRHHEDKQG